MATVKRWSVILLIVGISLIILVHWLNRPSHWRPLVIDSAETVSGLPFRAVPGEAYEVTFEFGRDIEPTIWRALTSTASQSIVGGQWLVRCDGEHVAGGKADNYLRIIRVRSWLGEAYRILARVPFGQDESKFHSFGLTGRFLAERSFGAFQIPDGVSETCGLTWRANDQVSQGSGVRLTVRRSDDDWTRHSARFAWLSLSGFVSFSAGILFWLIWRVFGLRRTVERQR